MLNLYKFNVNLCKNHINIIYDKTTTKYKVSLFLIIKRQQTFLAIMGFYAFLTTYTTQPSVTNFLCKYR